MPGACVVARGGLQSVRACRRRDERSQFEGDARAGEIAVFAVFVVAVALSSLIRLRTFSFESHFVRSEEKSIRSDRASLSFKVGALRQEREWRKRNYCITGSRFRGRPVCVLQHCESGESLRKLPRTLTPTYN